MKTKNLIIALALLSSTQIVPWWGDHREYRPGLLGGIFNTDVDIAEVPVAAVDDVVEGPGYYDRTYGYKDNYYGDGYGYNRRHYNNYKRDNDRRKEDRRRENSRSNQNSKSSNDRSRNR